jgi:hypothetical protein
MTSVAKLNVIAESGLRPLTNMWCPHTRKPRPPIASSADTIPVYPNTGLRPNTASTSETMPITGRMTM